jgi:hypothetical protein
VYERAIRSARWNGRQDQRLPAVLQGWPVITAIDFVVIDALRRASTVTSTANQMIAASLHSPLQVYLPITCSEYTINTGSDPSIFPTSRGTCARLWFQGCCYQMHPRVRSIRMEARRSSAQVRHFALM